ncbi:MAG: T9SS type A sorting domain-containing protein, partial [Bacteroidota bacterium]
AGEGEQGSIHTSDSTLDYVVHFQNSGTYYAEKVVIVDTLDKNLDWTTLEPGYSDHKYSAVISPTGVLQFICETIHLPWQEMTEYGSRGMVAYTIRLKKGLVPGDKIRNTAGIYFDYNEPVITNTTLNTIAAPDGIVETNTEKTVFVYPNPVSNEINVNVKSGVVDGSVKVMDLLGKVVKTERISTGKLDVSSLNTGIYVLQLKVDGQIETVKFVVSH